MLARLRSRGFAHRHRLDAHGSVGADGSRVPAGGPEVHPTSRRELRFSPDHAGRDTIDIGNFRTAKPKRIAAAGRLLFLGVGMTLGWLHRKREHRRKQQTKLTSFGSNPRHEFPFPSV